jgi:hypothetical protein
MPNERDQVAGTSPQLNGNQRNQAGGKGCVDVEGGCMHNCSRGSSNDNGKIGDGGCNSRSRHARTWRVGVRATPAGAAVTIATRLAMAATTAGAHVHVHGRRAYAQPQQWQWQ